MVVILVMVVMVVMIVMVVKVIVCARPPLSICDFIQSHNNLMRGVWVTPILSGEESEAQRSQVI